jgi:hypothetical protein
MPIGTDGDSAEDTVITTAVSLYVAWPDEVASSTGAGGDPQSQLPSEQQGSSR